MIKITIVDGSTIRELSCEAVAFSVAKPLQELADGPMNFHLSGQLVAIDPMPDLIERRPLVQPPAGVDPGAMLESRTV